MSERSVAEAVAEHPKLAGMLFTLLLVLSSVGSAAAGGAGNSIVGP